MKTITIFLCLCTLFVQGQNMFNGNFNNQGSGWGCNPEAIYTAATYGGTGNNRVAEVDAAAGLCQTIGGFTVGATYDLVFDCARRTNCGPSLKSMNITVDNGSFSVNVSRNGTPFQFTPETFSFTATATSHTLTFSGTSTGTCGLIVDNIALRSILPIDLAYFKATSISNEREVLLQWQTNSETNNDYFVVERSPDGIHWEAVHRLEAIGNSQQAVNYQIIDAFPLQGQSYYRLKQVDVDELFTYSKTQAVFINNSVNSAINIFPNPSKRFMTIIGLPMKQSTNIQLFNSIGQEVSNQISTVSRANLKVVLDLGRLDTGIYILKTPLGMHPICKQ